LPVLPQQPQQPQQPKQQKQPPKALLRAPLNWRPQALAPAECCVLLQQAQQPE
jgi:hypothetical protein